MVKALEVRRRVLGEEHPDTLSCHEQPGERVPGQGKFAKAEPLFVKALEVRRRVLGEEHPDTLRAMNNLAMLYRTRASSPRPSRSSSRRWKSAAASRGEHPDTLTAASNLADVYWSPT